jgi:hypothetical protein
VTASSQPDDFGIHRNNAASGGAIKARIKIQQITTSHNKRKKRALRIAFGNRPLPEPSLRPTPTPHHHQSSTHTSMRP